jgi:serine/threonine-protein kinase
MLLYTALRVEQVTPNKLGGGRVSAGHEELTEVDAPIAPETLPLEDELTSVVAGTPTPTVPWGARPFDIGIGNLLGEYRIEAVIGEGGMGTVFAAVHPVIGKHAAIKILRKELCADPQSVERFLGEARIVNEIGHRNIVDIFAFGETPDGRNYLVMEYLRGQTLGALIATRRLTLREVCTVLRSLAHALEAAHAKGVIHRDLKPENVFLVEDRDQWLVKLLDFGIAKLSRANHRVERTATGAMIGTPQYIAPEQAKGRAIDHRVDIYALGCVAFELLTGRAPFVADNAMEMVAKHLMEAPVSPASLTAVPSELDRLVLAMLAKDAAGRPPLAAVCEVLDRVLDGKLAPDPPPPQRRAGSDVAFARARARTEPVRPLAPRRGLRAGLALWLAAGVVTSGVAGFLVASWIANSRSGAPPEAARASAPLPAALEPGARQPGARQPATSTSGVRQPGGPPSGTQPGGTQPSGSQPSGSQPSGSQPSGSQPSGSQPGGSPSGSQPGGSPSGTAPRAPRTRLDSGATSAPDLAARSATEPAPRSLPPAPHLEKPKHRDVRLRVTPATAEIRLDSVILGDAVARVPLDGRLHTLSITAPSFVSKTIVLDGSTATPLEVQLTPKPLSL